MNEGMEFPFKRFFLKLMTPASGFLAKTGGREFFCFWVQRL